MNSAYRMALRSALCCISFASFCGPVRADEPIIVKPHPQAGTFVLKRDSDRPLLAFYGGIGLRELEDGRWTGYGQTSPKDVEYLIHRCVENGIQRIYGSVQEEGYPSEIAPAASGTADTDYVALCIKLAHENNIQVYADQPTFAFVKERTGAFLRANPRVLTRSVTDEPDSHMLSAAYPEVRRYKRSLLMELVQNYPLDGLQLDFIRFPYYQKDIRVGYGVHGYDEPTLRAFRALYGYASDYRPRPDDPRWLRMKSELVSQFIRELRADLKASGIRLPIGVYDSGMYGRADSFRTVHQDWRAWEEEGLVDEHSPMFYMSNGMANLASAIKSLAAVKGPHSKIIGPIFLSEGYMPGEKPTPDEIRDVARRLIKLGCDELWFCRASEIEQFGLWPVVKEISGWSISKIRAEDFDPAYENLLKNGSFDAGLVDWNPSADASVKVIDEADAPRVCRLTPGEKKASVQQTLTFRPIAHLALNSLTVTARARGSAAGALVVCLTYLDGSQETRRFALSSLTRTWKPFAFDVEAQTDFKRKIVTKAEISAEAEPGDGFVDVDEMEVQRDLYIDRGMPIPQRLTPSESPSHQ